MLLFARVLDAAQVRENLFQQSHPCGYLGRGHFPLTLGVLNQGVENIAVFDFIPVLGGHYKTGWSTAHFSCSVNFGS